MNLRLSYREIIKMDNFELIKITEGKNRKESLVFHIAEIVKKRHFELVISHVHQNSHRSMVRRNSNLLLLKMKLYLIFLTTLSYAKSVHRP